LSQSVSPEINFEFIFKVKPYNYYYGSYWQSCFAL
jgi:hypothetical protein